MPKSEFSSKYPGLANLLGGWFDQDYDLTGDTLEEIIPDYVQAKTPEHLKTTRDEIDQFISDYGQTDDSLADAMEMVFRPDVIIEGWDGMTTRQWLERVKELIQQSA